MDRLPPGTEGGFVYLASPYSDSLGPFAQDVRFREVCLYSYIMHQQHVTHFCPIIMCHPVASTLGMPTDAAFWQAFNKAFIDTSSGLVVAQMQGWEESRGVRQEMSYAEAIGLPIFLAQRLRSNIYYEQIHLANKDLIRSHISP